MRADETKFPTDPWEKVGWVMGGVWLLFLGFPIVAAWKTTAPWPVRVGIIALIVVFAVIYLWGIARSAALLADQQGLAWAVLVVLTLLVAVVAWLVGIQVIGMVIFIIAYASWAFPLVVSAALCVAGIAVMLAAGPLTGQGADSSFLGIIGMGVAVGGMISRIVSQRSDTYQEAKRDLEIVTERERLARDVHDLLGHSLTVIAAKSELAERLVQTDPARARTEMADINVLAREAIGQVRSTVGGLRTRQLTDEIAAARTALAAAEVNADIADAAASVQPHYRVLFAWVLREAVTNVVRHARARRCTVIMGDDFLQVIDDGVGYAGRDGQGLAGLRERIREAGGELTVVATAPGTTLTVRMVTA